MHESVEQLWHIVYEALEKNHDSALKTITATNGARTEVQFRLTKNLSALRSGDVSALDAVAADIFLLHTMGVLTDESFDKAAGVLDSIRL